MEMNQVIAALQDRAAELEVQRQQILSAIAALQGEATAVPVPFAAAPARAVGGPEVRRPRPCDSWRVSSGVTGGWSTRRERGWHMVESEPSDPVRRLVGQWRQEAGPAYQAGADVRAHAAAAAILLCASELDAALAVRQPGPPSVLDGPRPVTALDLEYQRALATIHGQAEALATLRAALVSAYDYLYETHAPCDPDCECILHGLEPALGKPDSRPQLTPPQRAEWDLRQRHAGRWAAPTVRCSVLGDAADPQTRCILVRDHEGDHACPDWPTRLAELAQRESRLDV